MARAESCHCARPENSTPLVAPLPLSFFFHSQYMLHHGAGYTRLHQSDGVFWRETKLSKVDMINCFYFLFEISTAVMPRWCDVFIFNDYRECA
ncbi:hypothetical protein N7447_005712 [Penicillium robsamsonii]|uniref:uncharacterized protein n=1 Tax=Penicillium robsamsonii TaxID=1792511 RepID=UPI002547758F|nr:uncharacterized protein N7447_005712 [Penicillium robsamsonii]KAJ5823372.1 hypothetical protein N7447_005712 [Penicillium robsamsonii]